MLNYKYKFIVKAKLLVPRKPIIFYYSEIISQEKRQCIIIIK